MNLFDKITDKRFIAILFIVFVSIVLIFTATVLTKGYLHNKTINAEKQEFLQHVENSDFEKAREIWPFVYTNFRDDTFFLEEYSTLLFEVYTKYYEKIKNETIVSNEEYLFCRDFHSFIDENSFDIVVSAIYDDLRFGTIEYLTFTEAINDFFLFSKYESPKIVGLMDRAASLNISRQSFLLAESSQLINEYKDAIDLYRGVIPEDAVYYPLALERIEECTLLLKEKLISYD